MTTGERREPGSVDEGQEQQENGMNLELFDVNQLKEMLKWQTDALDGFERNKQKSGKNEEADRAIAPSIDFITSQKIRIEAELAKREQVEK